MSFEESLVQELETIAAISGRIYPLSAPDTRYDMSNPYCIYISSEGMRTKEITSGYLSGRSVQAEVNIIAGRYGDVKSITASVLDLLVGFEQRSIGTGGPFIQELTYQMPVELYEEAPKLYRCLIEFEVYF